MKILRLTLFYFIQLTWGVIQNVLGFLIWLYVLLTGPKEKRRFFHGGLLTRWNLPSSMSMGIFLFMGTDDMHVVVHEYGHTIQSMILGPFYLPLIGLPSLIWANSPRYISRRRAGRCRYSSFYPERWANYLGRKYTGREPISY